MMSPDQLATLRAEVVSDMSQLGYAQFIPARLGALCELLNSPTELAVQPLSAARALTWAATGPMAKIVDASNDSAHPARASCLAFLHATYSGMDVDLRVAEVVMMFAGWQASDVITADQYAALLARAKQPVSRMAFLGLPAVTIEDLYASGAI